MAKTITTRLPDEFVVDISKVAEEENVDKSAAIRKLLAIALREWKIKKALDSAFFSEGIKHINQQAPHSGEGKDFNSLINQFILKPKWFWC